MDPGIQRSREKIREIYDRWGNDVVDDCDIINFYDAKGFLYEHRGYGFKKKAVNARKEAQRISCEGVGEISVLVLG